MKATQEERERELDNPTRPSLTVWTAFLIGLAVLGGLVWHLTHPSVALSDRGQNDRFFCESYCEATGGALISIENGHRDNEPTCTCLFADPD